MFPYLTPYFTFKHTQRQTDPAKTLNFSVMAYSNQFPNTIIKKSEGVWSLLTILNLNTLLC